MEFTTNHCEVHRESRLLRYLHNKRNVVTLLHPPKVRVGRPIPNVPPKSCPRSQKAKRPSSGRSRYFHRTFSALFVSLLAALPLLTYRLHAAALSRRAEQGGNNSALSSPDLPQESKQDARGGRNPSTCLWRRNPSSRPCHAQWRALCEWEVCVDTDTIVLSLILQCTEGMPMARVRRTTSAAGLTDL